MNSSSASPNAWQEVPGSVFIGLIDTIRTRVLRLALELKDDLGEVHDQIKDLPKEQVDRSVINNIYGGTNIIASSHFTQIGRIEIVQGDWARSFQTSPSPGEGSAIHRLRQSGSDHEARRKNRVFSREEASLASTC
jgi:hypothetical protein